MKLSDFKLLKEDDKHYEIGHPNGKSMMIPKEGLSEESHKKIKMMAGGGEVEDDEEPESEAPQADSSDSAGAQPSQAPVSAPVAPMASKPMQGLSSPSIDAALQNQRAAIGEQAAAQGKLGSQEASDINKTLSSVQKYPSIMDIQNKAKQKDDEFMKSFMTSNIDPNRYLHNMKTGSKIATGIGMILGGLGSGLTHQPNPSYEYLKDAINRDIGAQQADQSKKLTLWKMNREATGSDIAATLQTQNQLYTGLKYKLMQAEQNAQNPIQMARAKQAQSVIDQEIAQNRFKMSVLYPSAESTKGAPQGTEQAFNNHLEGLHMVAPEYYKEAEARYIPGIGVAKKPPTPQDIADLKSMDQLQKSIDDAYNFTNTVGKTLGFDVPLVGPIGSDNYHEGLDKRNAIILQLKQLFNSKRLDEHSFKAYMDMVPDPGQVRSDLAKQKLHSLAHIIDDKKKSIHEGLGIQPFAKTPEDQAAIQIAKDRIIKDPNDEVARKVLQLNGIR